MSVTDIMESADMQTLEDRMKNYEEHFNHHILPHLPYCVRLDGRSFSKYTSGFKTPVDNLFQCAMINTMNDLVSEFSSRTGYTHSDEITLIFPAVCTLDEYNTKTNKSTHIYDGRVMKICSIFASFCSARFNFHICRLFGYSSNKSHYKEEVVRKIQLQNACFDCRIIQFPDDKSREIVNLLIWRSIRDSYRNMVSTYGRKYFSHKQLEGKNSDQVIDMLKNEANIDWNKNVPIFHKHGVYAKRELYTKEVEIKGIKQEVIRQIVTNKSFIIKYSDEFFNLLMAKDWPAKIEDGDDIHFTDIVFTTDGSIKMM